MNVAIVRIDPHDEKLGLLAPAFAARVKKHAAELQPEVEPVAYTADVMTTLWQRQPTTLALGLVDTKTAQLVGHALATVQAPDTVYVSQLRADGNVGQARLAALDAVLQWASLGGYKRLILATHRDGKDFERFGFKRFRTLMELNGARQDAEPEPAQG